MTKILNFGKKNNNNSIYNPFLDNTYSTDYSKTIDNIIFTDLIDKNSYLFKNKAKTVDIFSGEPTGDIILNGGPKLYSAAKFITNYKKYTKKYNLPYILGKMYTLSDGTPIVFYDDEIQIGFNVYKYNDFSDLSFLNSLNTNTKKTIINIYTNGAANIKINLL